MPVWAHTLNEIYQKVLASGHFQSDVNHDPILVVSPNGHSVDRRRHLSSRYPFGRSIPGKQTNKI